MKNKSTKKTEDKEEIRRAFLGELWDIVEEHKQRANKLCVGTVLEYGENSNSNLTFISAREALAKSEMAEAIYDIVQHSYLYFSRRF